MTDFSPTRDINIILADDDLDDCLLFKEALQELPLPLHLITVYNGEQLMQLLEQKIEQLPDMIFLDINMPRKTGFQCLSEIKQCEKLKQIPVIVYSTSFQQDIVNLLYKNGAQHFIRKPNEFALLKGMIYQAITSTIKAGCIQPEKEVFVLSQ